VSQLLASSASRFAPYFEDRHRALAASIEATIDRARLSGDPLGVARALGRGHAGGGLDLYAWLVPEKLGGASAGRPDDPRHVDVRALVVVRELLGGLSAMADSIFAVQGLGSYPVSAFGTDEQRARVLPGVLDGTRIGAFGLTEPEAGSDVASLRTQARREGDTWVLEGHKTLISNVGIADHVVVFATVDPALGRKGITAFLVDTRAPGVHATPLHPSSPHPLGELRFDGVRLRDADRVGEVGEGFRIAMETLDAFRISVGAAACGMARRALSLSLERTSARVQFGKPLAEQPVVQSMLAEMATELDASRLLVARAAHARDTEPGGRHTTEAAMAKLYATEAAQRVIDRAVQLHGGSGVLLGSEVEQLYRDVRPLRIYEGTSEIQHLVIARGIMRG
jgi:acyl-CoA dehydrogenase